MKFTKDPGSTLDYTVDWTTWLGTDTIASVVWTVPTDLTQTNATNTTLLATVWLSGGTVGATYKIVCQITTAAGRIEERYFFIEMVDK